MGITELKVPIPAIIIALWIRRAVCADERPLAPPTIIIGAILATNIAKYAASQRNGFSNGNFSVEFVNVFN